MNCYYSNLIEGHSTHPIDIERALHNDYSQDPFKRDLQLEAKAHVEVQKWIDSGAVAKQAAATTTIQELHRRFVTELTSWCRKIPRTRTNRAWMRWQEYLESGSSCSTQAIPRNPHSLFVSGRHATSPTFFM